MISINLKNTEKSKNTMSNYVSAKLKNKTNLIAKIIRTILFQLTIYSRNKGLIS
jgi:hypothetical protein